MERKYWIVKQEPGDYSWAQFTRDGCTAWTGVRNFLARNHLRAMAKGDGVFFYHSGGERQVVGLATVDRDAYPDPTAQEGDWSAVDIRPVIALEKPVPLAALKGDSILNEMPLVRQSRLSVSPLTAQQARRILELSGTAWDAKAVRKSRS